MATGATILFLSLRFSDLYRVYQAADPMGPNMVAKGNTELFASTKATLL